VGRLDQGRRGDRCLRVQSDLGENRVARITLLWAWRTTTSAPFSPIEVDTTRRSLGSGKSLAGEVFRLATEREGLAPRPYTRISAPPLLGLDKLNEAESICRKALALYQEHGRRALMEREPLIASERLGRCLHYEGRLDEAEAVLRESERRISCGRNRASAVRYHADGPRSLLVGSWEVPGSRSDAVPIRRISGAYHGCTRPSTTRMRVMPWPPARGPRKDCGRRTACSA